MELHLQENYIVLNDSNCSGKLRKRKIVKKILVVKYNYGDANAGFRIQDYFIFNTTTTKKVNNIRKQKYT